MEKIYCGSGKTKSGQYGEFYAISICLDDLPNEHITTAANGKEYINITVSKKKETDQYGKDLAVTVDTWKPSREGKNEPVKSSGWNHSVPTPYKDIPSNKPDELPF
jgi:hypothetical protein